MKSLAASRTAPRRRPTAYLDRIARRAVENRLEQLQRGAVCLQRPDGRTLYGDTTAQPVRIDVHDAAFYSDIAFNGTVGAGESYMNGAWSCDDLVQLVRVLLQNPGLVDTVDAGMSRLTVPLRRVLHRLNRNTRSGSRKNIAAHYDLGNDFYALWLDSSMMYSSAWFADESVLLEQASIDKLERICRKLNLQPGDNVLEIGTGWGGFAIHAAQRFGCHVTTTTISEQQHAYAAEQVARHGLESRITLLQSDYRDLTGRYDKLVSIEMVEAVGHEYLDTFIERCAGLLHPHGEMLLQAITIADQRYDFAKRNVDFIKRYIFPGGFLPSLTALVDAMTRVSDLRAIEVDDLGLHYARTLRLWRQNFNARLDAVRAQGFPESFIRMWEFYLCYCEGAFRERAIGNIQLHAIKPAARPALNRGF